MNIGIVQSSPVFGEVEGNLSGCLEFISSQSADLWVLPELFASEYQLLNANVVRALAERVPCSSTKQLKIA